MSYAASHALVLGAVLLGMLGAAFVGPAVLWAVAYLHTWVQFIILLWG